MTNPFEAKPHFSIFEGPGTFANTPSAGGDFSEYDLPTRIEFHSNWVKKYLEASQGIPRHLERETNRLNGEIQALQHAIWEPTRTVILDSLQSRFIVSDLLTLYKSPEERAAERLRSFKRWHVASDVDGTMTDNQHEYIPHNIPGSDTAEELLRERGRESFSEVFPFAWQESLKHDPKTYREGGRTAQIRRGVNECLGYLKDEKNARITALSANHDAVVYGVLDQIPNAIGIQVCAVRKDSVLATAKGEILDFMAIENPDEALIFIGDGSSDLAALNSKGVAVYFALEDGVFAKELEKEGKPYFTYRTFTDIELKLREIDTIRKTLLKAA